LVDGYCNRRRTKLINHRPFTEEEAQLLRRYILIAFLAIFLLAVPSVPQARAAGCPLITLSVTPSIVNLPSGLPSPNAGPAFGEIADVNYSTLLNGQLIFLQYQNSSGWTTLKSFTANGVGFTETTLVLNSGWARLGLNNVRALSLECASAPVGFTISVDKSAVLLDALVYLLLVVFGVAFFLVGKFAKVGIFLVVATVVYLAIAPFTGQRYDVFFLASSGIRILQHVNPFDPGQSALYPGALKWAYPPLYPVYSAVSYLVYQLSTGTPLPSVASLTWPGYLTAIYNVWEAFVPKTLPVLVSLLKLPMIASAVGTALVLQKMTGQKSAAVLWLANPLVVLVAAVWGQLDPVATLLALVSLYYYNKNKEYHAYFLASMGAAVKLWPAILIPLFFANSLKRGGRSAIRPMAAVLPALLVSLGLYAAYGGLVQTLLVFLYARGVPTYAGSFTVNGLTWQQVLLTLHSPPVPIFLVLGIPLYILVLAWIYKKGDGDVTKWLIVSILIFYLTYNYVNPQYFYWILPFLILRGRKAATWLFTALPMVYVAVSYNIFYFVSPAVLFDEFSSGPSIVEQLKVAFFYTVPIEFLLVSAAAPTIACIVLLRNELKRRSQDGQT
jgi:hypothetical protein